MIADYAVTSINAKNGNNSKYQAYGCIEICAHLYLLFDSSCKCMQKSI